MRIILEELTRRLTHLHLAEEQEYEYLSTLLFRGVQHL